MRKIGILGGTFDPVHNAHLALADYALKQYELDLVLFVPAGLPVRKQGKTHASPAQRLQMLKLACEGSPRFEISTVEIDRPEISYTIDTLRELQTLYGEQGQLFLIVGEDNATDLATWKDSAEIAQLVTVLYAKRPGIDTLLVSPKGFTCQGIDMPQTELSSSHIRNLLEAGDDVSACLPLAVFEYIKQQGLYGQSE